MRIHAALMPIYIFVLISLGHLRTRYRHRVHTIDPRPLNLPRVPIADNTPTTPAGTVWFEYPADAYRGPVLSLDSLRRRGDQQAGMTARPMATVLRFKRERLVSGPSLPGRQTIGSQLAKTGALTRRNEPNFECR